MAYIISVKYGGRFVEKGRNVVYVGGKMVLVLTKHKCIEVFLDHRATAPARDEAEVVGVEVCVRGTADAEVGVQQAIDITGEVQVEHEVQPSAPHLGGSFSNAVDVRVEYFVLGDPVDFTEESSFGDTLWAASISTAQCSPVVAGSNVIVDGGNCSRALDFCGPHEGVNCGGDGQDLNGGGQWQGNDELRVCDGDDGILFSMGLGGDDEDDDETRDAWVEVSEIVRNKAIQKLDVLVDDDNETGEDGDVDDEDDDDGDDEDDDGGDEDSTAGCPDWFVGMVFKNIKQLREAMRIYGVKKGDGRGLALVSDMQKAEHRMCARHIYANWQKKWKGLDKKIHFWKCTRSTYVQDFAEKLGSLTRKQPKDYVSHWYRKAAYTASYEHSLGGMRGKKYWPLTDDRPLLPPAVRPILGRPKRNKEKDKEEPKKTGKLSRYGETRKCTKCGKDHNRRTCGTGGHQDNGNDRPEEPIVALLYEGSLPISAIKHMILTHPDPPARPLCSHPSSAGAGASQGTEPQPSGEGRQAEACGEGRQAEASCRDTQQQEPQTSGQATAGGGNNVSAGDVREAEGSQPYGSEAAQPFRKSKGRKSWKEVPNATVQRTRPVRNIHPPERYTGAFNAQVGASRQGAPTRTEARNKVTQGAKAVTQRGGPPPPGNQLDNTVKRGRPVTTKQHKGPEQPAKCNKYNQGNYGYRVMYNEKTKTYVQNAGRPLERVINTRLKKLKPIPQPVDAKTFDIGFKAKGLQWKGKEAMTTGQLQADVRKRISTAVVAATRRRHGGIVASTRRRQGGIVIGKQASRKPISDCEARQPTRVPRQVRPGANPRIHSCWVQLHNIPNDFICHSVITRVTRANFPAFYSYDPYVVSLFGGKRFVRVKVGLDFCRPLLPGVHHAFKWDEIWITFKYENLGSLCYRCGMVGHLIGGCPLEKRDSEGIELPHDTSCGHWMKPCHFDGRF
ncbi:hypothetical protein Tsubulata_024743 [Turnera subulata]|uniref:CCHC-type domain-containing protein n=1 Tax=Turnera subulata TaxID=218843 RepID=A0A9Q0FEL2_9ROSI|nr:hypothetical protein Tsubulata_024743 [Turnera subulata]